MITNTDKQFLGLAGVNYFRSPGIENGNLDFSPFSTTYVNNVPTTITPGAANVTVLGTYGNALRGNFYLDAGFTGSNLGQGLISPTLQIDSADLAKVLTISFEYRVVSGVFNASGTSTQSLEVWIYDVVNAVWIQPAGYRGMNQTSGSGRLQCTFQTASNSSQYRVALIVKNAVICTIIFDTFAFGPQSTVQGAAISDWVSFTPTGSWAANTTYTGRWKRVGDSVQVQASLSLTGAPTATRLIINLPSGLVIDNTKRSGGASATINNIFGTGKTFDGATAVHNLTVAYESTTAVAVSYESTATAQLNNVTNTSPFTYNSGDVLDIEYTVPIQGWSSNTVMSQDTDTRVVAATARGSPASATSGNIIIFPSSLFDTHGGYSTTTGRYTVPVSGMYRIAFAHVGNGNYFCTPYVNGATTNIVMGPVISGFGSGSVILPLNTGDIVDHRPVGGNAGPFAAQGGNFTVERLSGPATIASSETVAARYKTSAGNSITNAATNYLDFVDKEYDTHGMVSIASPAGNKLVQGTGWKATIPISGKYHISAQILSQSGASWNAGEIWEIFITKNGADIAVNGSYSQATHTTYMPAVISLIISLNAGDIIEICGYQTSGASINMFANGRNNFVQIYRVGN